MDYQQSFAISAAGMEVERLRVDVVALNLANAHTVLGVDGQSYQPMRVVARGEVRGAVDLESFASRVQRGLAVPVASVEPAATPARRVYEPGNPLADSRGFVAYPGVDLASEMVTLMSAMRAYEANVAAMNAARALALKALEIGGTA